MDYINETYPAEVIVKSAQRIAIPGGKESGYIENWLDSVVGWNLPEFNGRCLHRNCK